MGWGLAGFAEVGGSAADDDALDGLAAGGAGLVCAGVDFVALLEFALVTGGVAVVAEGAAAVADGLAEDPFDGAGEALGLIGGEAVGGSEGMDGGTEEGFIDVDVAEAGDEGLVEEGGFDGA